MYLANRRFTLRLLAGSALVGALPHSAGAQEDIVVPNSLENIKRGTIHTLDPKTRGFVIVWEDLGRVKMKAAMTQGARLQGIPGAQERIRIWSMDGMCTKVDLANNQVFLINASGGEPDKPAPDSGEVIQLPVAQSAAGQAAAKSAKPGDLLITVWSQQTAIKATVIR